MPTPKDTIARTLAYVTWLTWMVMFAGAKYFPEAFQRPFVSVLLLGIVGLASPLTVLFGIRYAMRQGSWKASCVLILAGAIPFCVNVGSFGLNLLSLDQVSSELRGFDMSPSPPSDSMLEQARDASFEVERRRSAAWAVYGFWGFRVMWLNQAGELVAFEPTEEEVRMRAEHLFWEAKWAQTGEIFHNAAQRHRAIFVFQVALFLAILLPGLLIISRKQKPYVEI